MTDRENMNVSINSAEQSKYLIKMYIKYTENGSKTGKVNVHQK